MLTEEELAVCDYARPNEDAKVHKYTMTSPADPRVEMCLACGRAWERKGEASNVLRA